MTTSQITYEEARSRTDEAHASNHFTCFGNINRLNFRDVELESIERLQGIARLIKDVNNSINSMNADLTNPDPNIYVNLCDKRHEWYNRIRFKIRVRDRLIERFNKELDKMKMS